jgi:hypothetical protein
VVDGVAFNASNLVIIVCLYSTLSSLPFIVIADEEIETAYFEDKDEDEGFVDFNRDVCCEVCVHFLFRY